MYSTSGSARYGEFIEPILELAIKHPLISTYQSIFSSSAANRHGLYFGFLEAEKFTDLLRLMSRWRTRIKGTSALSPCDHAPEDRHRPRP